MGQVRKDTLPAGVYQTATKTIYEVSAKEIGVSLQDLKPRASDNLIIQDLDVDIYFQIDGSKAAEILIKYAGDLTRDESGTYRVGYNFVVRSAREAIYTAVAHFPAVTMHQHRPELSDAIVKALQTELDNGIGKNWVKVTTVNIRNLVTDSKLEESIREIATQETKFKQAVAAQRTLIEENKRKLLEQEGQANAVAAQRLIEAKNAAEMRVVEAKAQAEANRLINESLTPTLLRFREIEMTGRFADSKGTNTLFIPQGQAVIPMVNTSK